MRKSKRVLWELMSQLEEAGEEDLCSLLNQLMSVQPYFGSGVDLAEYLEALATLERAGELRVREYRLEEGRTVYGDVLSGVVTRPSTAFAFDPAERIWRWQAPTRQMVELPSD
jgi:hypothetical protein